MMGYVHPAKYAEIADRVLSDRTGRAVIESVFYDPGIKRSEIESMLNASASNVKRWLDLGNESGLAKPFEFDIGADKRESIANFIKCGYFLGDARSRILVARRPYGDNGNVREKMLGILAAGPKQPTAGIRKKVGPNYDGYHLNWLAKAGVVKREDGCVSMAADFQQAYKEVVSLLAFLQKAEKENGKMEGKKPVKFGFGNGEYEKRKNEILDIVKDKGFQTVSQIASRNAPLPVGEVYWQLKLLEAELLVRGKVDKKQAYGFEAAAAQA